MNSSFDTQSILKLLFAKLYRRGFRPGIGKYIAALKAVDRGYGNSPDDLKLTLGSLWCQSRDELAIFEIIWNETLFLYTEQKQSEISQASPIVNTQTNQEAPQSKLKKQIKPPKTPISKNNQTNTGSNTDTDIEIAEDQENLSISSLGTASTSISSNQSDEIPKFDFVPVLSPNAKLQEDFPISTRYMMYAWRRLRQSMRLGRPDILDVEATVTKVAGQSFYLKPIYQRREINRTHLILFVDREGSMTPFHRFVRHLVDTAKESSGIERVDVFYFRNVFEDFVFCDEYLTKPIALMPIEKTKAALTDCDHDAIVMIISDAGAARGHNSFKRLHASTEFLFELRKSVDTIIWLNPVPKDRWRYSSAEKIAYFVPMYPLDPENLSAAVDHARGQTNRK